MEARRKLKFVPGEIAKNFKETKQPPLKDMFDEWLMRIVCYCFSIDPTPFVAQVNRSVAETTRDQSLSEGMTPIKQWIKSLIDRVIVQCFGYTDIEFRWEDQVAIDPLVQAQINKVYLDAKVLHPDEVRADLGRDPLTPEQKEDLNPPPPPMLGGPDDGSERPPKEQKPNEPKPPEKEALGKAKKALPQIDRERSAVTNARDTLTTTITDFLAGQKQKFTAQIIAALGLEKSSQSGTPGNKAVRVVDDLDFEDWAIELYDPMQKALAGVVVDGGGEALKQLGVFDDDVLSAVSANAEEWATARAAEMVGMKWVDGELIPNPDAKWQITEGTREFLRADVSAAMDEGLGANELASRLSENYAFSDTRAEVIARTETARADIAGSQIGWQSSGLVSMREWNAAPECCDECQEMHGELAPLDGPFKGGADVPLHPQCLVGDSRVLADGITSAMKRWFDGDIVVIRTASGKQLSCTTNHPILTSKGWVAAGVLNIGGNVISSGVSDWMTCGSVDDKNAPPAIKNVAESFLSASGVISAEVPVSSEYFHGDGQGSDVAIVGTNKLLWSNDDSARQQQVDKCLFVMAGNSALCHVGSSNANSMVDALASPFDSGMGSGDLLNPLLGSHASPFSGFGLGLRTPGYVVSDENTGNGFAINTNSFGDGVFGLTPDISRANFAVRNDAFIPSGLDSRGLERAEDDANGYAEAGRYLRNGEALQVFVDAIVDFAVVSFSGHVFNLETENGYYVAEGIVTHNCRCDVLPVIDDE